MSTLLENLEELCEEVRGLADRVVAKENRREEEYQERARRAMFKVLRSEGYVPINDGRDLKKILDDLNGKGKKLYQTNKEAKVVLKDGVWMMYREAPEFNIVEG